MENFKFSDMYFTMHLAFPTLAIFIANSYKKDRLRAEFPCVAGKHYNGSGIVLQMVAVVAEVAGLLAP